MKRPNPFRLLCAAAIAMALLPPAATVAKPAAESSLVGAWRAASMTRGGQLAPSDAVRNLLFVFREKTVGIYVGSQRIADEPYGFNEKVDPKTIDIPFDGEKTLGIFKIEKGAMVIHANDPDKGRPVDFDAASDVALVLRRADRALSYVHVMDTDGGNQRILVESPEFTGVGSPEWSRDGRRLAYDGWRSLFGEDARLAHLLVCNADGTEWKDLGIGAMPTWSPDGKRIGFSCYEPRGVWTMKADGTDRKLIDAEGWAVEWRPTGDQVAYTVYDAGGSNVRVHDLKTGKTRDLLDGRYFYIYYGMAWSPDGQWIALVGRKEDASWELAIVHVEGHAKGFRVLVPTEGNDDFRPTTNPSWSPNGKQVLAALQKRRGSWALYAIDVNEPHAIRRIPGQREDRSYSSPAWSPEGKKIVFCAGKEANR
ncbi:MAG TPA: hypothetical protein VJL29_10845 [Thermoguttaceae bacterium]|nr:hypothetical protein [Thermoguttaceae bacterium]